MTAPALPAETYTVRLDALDVRRLFVQGTSAIGREVTRPAVSFIVNVVAWAAMATGTGVFFHLYESAPETRALLVFAAVTLVLGFVTAMGWWMRWNTLLLQGIVRDAAWQTREQTVTLDDVGVQVASDGYRSRYDWALFTRLEETEGELVLGNGGQPTVVVPKSGEVSEARLAWIRERTR